MVHVNFYLCFLLCYWNCPLYKGHAAERTTGFDPHEKSTTHQISRRRKKAEWNTPCLSMCACKVWGGLFWAGGSQGPKAEGQKILPRHQEGGVKIWGRVGGKTYFIWLLYWNTTNTWNVCIYTFEICISINQSIKHFICPQGATS